MELFVVLHLVVDNIPINNNHHRMRQMLQSMRRCLKHHHRQQHQHHQRHRRCMANCHSVRNITVACCTANRVVVVVCVPNKAPQIFSLCYLLKINLFSNQQQNEDDFRLFVCRSRLFVLVSCYCEERWSTINCNRLL